MNITADVSARSQRLDTFKKGLRYLAIFGLAVGFYTVTRPLNHSESYDSINYGLFAENYPLGAAPDSRNILFQIVNRIVYVASQALGFNIRAIDLICGISITTGSMSLILFARLMKNGFGVSSFAAWCGAAFIGFSYGFWRYSAGAEVYSPSIFLVLCSLTFVFRYLNSSGKSWFSLLMAGAVAGLAILFYQPTVIPLLVVGVLFCWPIRIGALFLYSTTTALVLLVGLVSSYFGMHGVIPSANGLVEYVTSRNMEFRPPQPTHIAAIKAVLAFGHDVLSAHWTRTIIPVREVLDPYIPGCVYNFNVVVFAGKGIENLTAVAAILFVPIVILFGRLNWLAARKWSFSWGNTRTVFLLGWWAAMILVVGGLDPGSFEAWIPALVPFTGLLTVFVFEECCKQQKKKSLVVFLVLMMSYNFFGGVLIWRNTQGDYFFHKTAWVREQLTEGDTVLLNEFDYRMVDYLSYYSKARIVHLTDSNLVTIARSTPGIHLKPLDEFLTSDITATNRLFVFDDVLCPCPEIKQCRDGQKKFDSAVKLAKKLDGNTVLINTGRFGKTYQVKSLAD